MRKLGLCLLLILFTFVNANYQQTTEAIYIADNSVGIFKALGWQGEQIYQPQYVSVYAHSGPNDEVLIRTEDRENIYQVYGNGTVTIYKSFWPGFLENFAFDNTGKLWMTSNSGQLWTLDQQGNPQQITPNGININRNFAIASNGDIYAVDDTPGLIQRITQSGQISTFAQYGSNNLAVIDIGPNDEIVVMDRTVGDLLLFNPSGFQKVIASGISGEEDPVFAPDGTLYLINWSGLETIDIDTGVRTRLTWYDRYSNTTTAGDFDSQGRLITFSANRPIFRFDLQAQTGELMHHPYSWTGTIATAPDGEVYIAYGDTLPFPDGETVLFRVGANNQLEEIVRVPLGRELAIALKQDGTGYLTTGDVQEPSRLYEFDPVQKTYSYLMDLNASRLAVDPTTDYLWFSANTDLRYLDNQNNIVSVPVPPNMHSFYFGFQPDGTLYAVILFNAADEFSAMTRGLYRREADDSWTEIWYYEPTNRFNTYGVGIPCVGGKVYITTVVDGDMIQPGLPNPDYDVLMGVDDNGNIEIIAYETPVDAFGIACDWNTGEIYTSSIPGVTKYYQWATDFIYLPTVLRAP